MFLPEISSETSAILALLAYALTTVLVLARHARACPDGWQVWVLHLIARSYAPCAFSQRIRQRSPHPANGGALVLVNHRGPVDPLFIFAANAFRRDGFKVRIIEFMTASEYCELTGPLGWIVRTMRVIPVDRNGSDMEAAKEALKRIRRGRIVGIFPEGRLNTGEGLLPGNPGVAWLALRGRVPVYPVFIHNAPRASGMVEPFLTFQKVQISYGEAIDLSQFEGRRPTPETLQEVTRYLMERLAVLEETFVHPEETRLPPVNAVRKAREAEEAVRMTVPQAI